MRVDLVVKLGQKDIFRLTGRESVSLNADDLKRLLETEALLERATGYRFHISVQDLGILEPSR